MNGVFTAMKEAKEIQSSRSRSKAVAMAYSERLMWNRKKMESCRL